MAKNKRQREDIEQDKYEDMIIKDIKQPILNTRNKKHGHEGLYGSGEQLRTYTLDTNIQQNPVSLFTLFTSMIHMK